MAVAVGFGFGNRFGLIPIPAPDPTDTGTDCESVRLCFQRVAVSFVSPNRAIDARMSAPPKVATIAAPVGRS